MSRIAQMSDPGYYYSDWDRSYFDRTGGGDGTPFFSFWNNLKRAINRAGGFESSAKVRFQANGIWIVTVKK